MAVATRAGLSAFRRSFENPDSVGQDNGGYARLDHYRRLWAYYTNDVYEDLNTWGAYKQVHGLYRATRAIYNPTRRLVDFYAGAVYPGVLSEDGDRLPEGVPLAIPLAQDTDPDLKDAIAQFWQWSNWQASKSVLVRYGAALGNVLVEVSDDLDRRKITADVVWPGLVADLHLDACGNIVSYALEYAITDGADRHTYRKEVDKAVYRTFRDGQPFAYDEALGAAWPNPYGFVPAVWVRHIHVGSDYGAPAIEGSLGKVDELNSLASHTHDQVHKKIAAPALLAGVTNLRPLTNQEKRQATAGTEYGAEGRVLVDREDLMLIGAPEGARVESLAGTLELADAGPYLERLLGEVEQDHPELTLYRELRGMSQVTGPGASRMLGDAAARVYEAAANYDQASISLFRMAVAIGGYRANAGAWGPLDRQQQKFAPFDLSSYANGDLDFSIVSRPLVQPTQQERWAENLAMWTAAKAAVDAGAPLEVWARDAGWDDEKIAAFGQMQVDAIKRQQMLAAADTVDGIAQ
jgi:hypothetical protein